jgi:BlaI family penicillinase repressor
MAIKHPKPTKLELSILRVLWDKGTATVREVHNTLNETKETGYTTVLKMMQLMTDKGMLDRDESVRPQVYRAKHSAEKTQRQILSDLIQRAFGGSMKALVMQAVATRKSTPEDMEAISKILDKFEGGSK